MKPRLLITALMLALVSGVLVIGHLRAKTKSHNGVPFGINLTAAPGAKLVRLADDTGTSYGYYRQVDGQVGISCQAATLNQILVGAAQERLWHEGLSHLPDGQYSLSFTNDFASYQELWRTIANVYEAAFTLKISVSNKPWDSTVLTVASTNLPRISVSTKTESRRATAGIGKGFGMKFEHVTMAEFCTWVEQSIGKPVVDGTGLTNYLDIGIECWPPDPKTILPGLRAAGFQTTSGISTQKTAIIQPAHGHTP